ncbi:hypothetical protein [Pseudotabrizicola sp. L79]|uniref:hypothetical protein n=1 Tax=Pseudotabrizicola sp. L79 TaxID=3118402 RepID=UPI002F922107
MTRSSFPMRALILAAYLLAAILPMLAFADGRQQSQADHEQMMAMAGHVAHMSSAGSPIDDAQRLLCQQHCLFASAALPALSPGVVAIARSVEIKLNNDLVAASLAFPPPGRPPKRMLI